eukprot:GGOE01015437.1.p2 GENE.GGOE01015437.1~~GGOE01015437.1.p2  ORF type:complete len:209 (-),score=31.11 GGOE01015437.1:314-865(-)
MAESSLHSVPTPPVVLPASEELLHPCLRFASKCQYGDKCSFANLPRSVCIFYIKGRCIYGGACRDLHLGQDDIAQRLNNGAKDDRGRELPFVSTDPHRMRHNRLVQIQRLLHRFTSEPMIHDITFSNGLTEEERHFIRDFASRQGLVCRAGGVSEGGPRLTLSKEPVLDNTVGNTTEEAMSRC